MGKKKQTDGVGAGALIKRKKEKKGVEEARLALGTGFWGLQH